MSRITLIRFVTEVDYPPFNYSGPDGNPFGFNVDLGRMICEELKIACTVQMRRFDTLLQSLTENRGAAVMASIAVTPETRKLADFSDPYYRTPARFVALRNSPVNDVRPEALEGKKVAVVAGSAHEAFLKALFTGSRHPALSHGGARARGVAQGRGRSVVRRRHLARLLAERLQNSQNCCAFRGGPFIESKYFGEGVGGIAVKRGNTTLRLAFNWALFRLWEKGRFSDLWLRYFPISPF